MSDRVRAVLVTRDDRLLTIKRVKPGQAPYWVLPGGGVDPGDASLEAALHREIREELAGTADIHSLLQVVDRGSDRQHIYLARIRCWDFAAKSGPEFTETGRGEYILEEVPLTTRGLAGIDLVPVETAELLKRTVSAGADLFALPDLRIGVA
jgi:ADP-ribose pyrophosphatase